MSQVMPASQPRSAPVPIVQPDPLLSAIESARHIGVCRATFWADVKNGRMPQPYYINARRPRWRLSELDAAIAAAKRRAVAS